MTLASSPFAPKKRSGRGTRPSKAGLWADFARKPAKSEFGVPASKNRKEKESTLPSLKEGKWRGLFPCPSCFFGSEPIMGARFHSEKKKGEKKKKKRDGAKGSFPGALLRFVLPKRITCLHLRIRPLPKKNPAVIDSRKKINRGMFMLRKGSFWWVGWKPNRETNENAKKGQGHGWAPPSSQSTS